MKLSRIPGHEATVKHSFAFKQSTTSLLQQYQELYASHTGMEVSLKDVVEQMLLDFMAEDKAFQKQLKQRQDAPGVAGSGVAAQVVASTAPSGKASSDEVPTSTLSSATAQELSSTPQ